MGCYTRLGGTRDDAVGEAFDKVARLLRLTEGLVGHGGAAVERAAAASTTASRKKFKLTVPMRQKRWNCDLSYSGLKTAVLRHTHRDDVCLEPGSADVLGLAGSFQETALMHLKDRTALAIRWGHVARAHVHARPRPRPPRMCKPKHTDLRAQTLAQACARAHPCKALGSTGYHRRLRGGRLQRRIKGTAPGGLRPTHAPPIDREMGTDRWRATVAAVWRPFRWEAWGIAHAVCVRTR